MGDRGGPTSRNREVAGPIRNPPIRNPPIRNPRNPWLLARKRPGKAATLGISGLPPSPSPGQGCLARGG
eukprot:4376179-Alexandrium_andersonii.AAC.1